MGMFDSIYCRTELPGVGVRDDEFQTKDTPPQFLEIYEIRVDGTLWREAYDTVDHSDPTAVGLGRLAGSLARENLRWEREYLSGRLRFYTDTELGSLEFEARLVDGKCIEIIQIKEGTDDSECGLRFDPATVDRISTLARSEGRDTCVQLVLERAKEAEESGDETLGLTLRTLALRMRL